MQSILKVCNMKSMIDVNRIRNCICKSEGIIACEIDKDKGEVSIVYDKHCLKIEDVLESMEDLGYTIL